MGTQFCARLVPGKRLTGILFFVLEVWLSGVVTGCGSSSGGSSTPVKTTPTVAWATPAPITYGTALSSVQLDATASVPGTFTYSPTAGTIETGGTQTLTATFTPTVTTDYNTATASVSLTVTQATPTITWPTPASTTQGTPLSSTQLDATANVSGSLVYSPSAGTIEPLGVNTLSVIFTPNDTTDYTTATAAVSLTVTSQSGSTPQTTLSFVQQMVNLDNLAEFPAGSSHNTIDSDDPRKLPPTSGTSPTCFYCDVDGGNFFGDMTINGVLRWSRLFGQFSPIFKWKFCFSV